MKNYYQILGLESTASQEDIKKAYREYAQHFHPDKQGGSKFFEERFKEVKEAYEILSNETKRAKYDLKHNQNTGQSSNNQNNKTKQTNYSNQEKEREAKEQEQERKKKQQDCYRAIAVLEQLIGAYRNLKENESINVKEVEKTIDKEIGEGIISNFASCERNDLLHKFELLLGSLINLVYYSKMATCDYAMTKIMNPESELIKQYDEKRELESKLRNIHHLFQKLLFKHNINNVNACSSNDNAQRIINVLQSIKSTNEIFFPDSNSYVFIEIVVETVQNEITDDLVREICASKNNNLLNQFYTLFEFYFEWAKKEWMHIAVDWRCLYHIEKILHDSLPDTSEIKKKISEEIAERERKRAEWEAGAEKREEERKKREDEKRIQRERMEETMKKYNATLDKIRKDRQAQESCYIATMVYGDYNHPQVLVLRQFRDEILDKSILGRWFIKTYYYYSPKLVEHLKDKKTIDNFIRCILNQFIKTIK